MNTAQYAYRTSAGTNNNNDNNNNGKTNSNTTMNAAWYAYRASVGTDAGSPAPGTSAVSFGTLARALAHICCCVV